VSESAQAPDNLCFCELAPLYVLDLLNETEQRWVEQQVADCPELAEELEHYRQAIAPLPYAAPPIAPAAHLKDRLFQNLGLETPPPAIPQPAPAPFLSIRAHELHWQPHRVPKVSVAILHRDPVKREVVGVLRAEPDMFFPTHIHAAIEELYMLEGDLVIGDQTYGAGDYIRSSPGSSHAPYSVHGCMFFFRTSMDDEYPDLLATV
jgi:hypothetical protein